MITVFTSCYNQGCFLAEAIESVLSQTYKDFEYLLYNDGSTDNSWEIMQKYAKRDARIRCFNLEKQKNVGTVINKSFTDMKGDAWVWCPADDIFLPNLLQVKIEENSIDSNCILYNDWVIIDEKGNEGEKRITLKGDKDFFINLVKMLSPIGFTGIFVPKIILEKVGNFPEHLQFSEDFYWMLKAALVDNVYFKGIPQILHKKRRHGNRLTNRNSAYMIENVKNIREQINLILKEKQD